MTNAVARGSGARIARALALGGGIGLLPRAQGTAASLAALAAGRLLMRGPAWVLPSAALLCAPAGWLVLRATPEAANGDPSWVVIDEVAGQWLAMLGLGGTSPAGLVAAFALFRLLDIGKPGPIGWVDRQEGPLGIMLDDLLAGGVTALALVVARRLSSLGERA